MFLNNNLFLSISLRKNSWNFKYKLSPLFLLTIWTNILVTCFLCQYFFSKENKTLYEFYKNLSYTLIWKFNISLKVVDLVNHDFIQCFLYNFLRQSYVAPNLLIPPTLGFYGWIHLMVGFAFMSPPYFQISHLMFFFSFSFPKW